MTLDILYVRPRGSGWGPVAELVALAARLFDARVAVVDDHGEVSLFRKTAASLPRGRRRPGHHLLVVAPHAGMAAYAARPRLWFPGYDSTAVWVIDSFWTDRTPRLLRGTAHVDRVFITDPQLVEEWEQITGTPVSVLPWGADTALYPGAAQHRGIDVLRLGRQPEAWADDDATALEANRQGLRFAGRPPMSDDPGQNQRNVREALMGAKLVLAFSNLVSPAPYTHPTRDYLTGRWMDALAAGCLVAGTAPAAATSTLWDGATLEISPTSREDAWPILTAAAECWSPERAAEQQECARRTLDWRWRLRQMGTVMGWPEPPRLTRELERLISSPQQG